MCCFLMGAVPFLAGDRPNKVHRFAAPDTTMIVSGVETLQHPHRRGGQTLGQRVEEERVSAEAWEGTPAVVEDQRAGVHMTSNQTTPSRRTPPGKYSHPARRLQESPPENATIRKMAGILRVGGADGERPRGRRAQKPSGGLAGPHSPVGCHKGRGDGDLQGSEDAASRSDHSGGRRGHRTGPTIAFDTGPGRSTGHE